MAISNRRGKANLPTATAHEYRLRIFQATRRPVFREENIETSWGMIKVRGKLGQPHADMLDAILYCAEDSVRIEDGRLKILVDPANVRRVSGIGSGAQFEKLKLDLVGAVVEIKFPPQMKCVGHLVDHINYAQKKDGTFLTRFNPLEKNERFMWRVELGKTLSTLLQHDVGVSYDPKPIGKLKHGLTQAIVRHVLSHKNQPQGGWLIATLIRAVGGQEIAGQALWNRRRELMADSEKLREFGVLIEGDRVCRL